MKTETLKNIDQTVCDHSSIAEVQIENLTFPRMWVSVQLGSATLTLQANQIVR